jgi:predicted kinase
MKKSLILVRGMPGSGKSTLAKALNVKAICCADDYLIHDGEYHFIDNDAVLAHNWCIRKCREFMKKQTETIMVTNVFASDRELTPYIDLARQFGYTLFSIIVETRHGGKSSHDVPETSMIKFRNRFDIQL